MSAVRRCLGAVEQPARSSGEAIRPLRSSCGMYIRTRYTKLEAPRFKRRDRMASTYTHTTGGPRRVHEATASTSLFSCAVAWSSFLFDHTYGLTFNTCTYQRPYFLPKNNLVGVSKGPNSPASVCRERWIPSHEKRSDAATLYPTYIAYAHIRHTMCCCVLSSLSTLYPHAESRRDCSFRCKAEAAGESSINTRT